MTRDPSAAEDLTQDVFLRVYRKIGTFRGEASFSTWLYRLTVNEVLMKLRGRRNKISVVPIDDLADDAGQDGSLARALGAADPILHGTPDRIALEVAISNLPPGYRLAIVLHDIDGFAHHDIAEILGCTVGNSKSQLHKARIKLRRELLDTYADKRTGRYLAAVA